ncbi:histidine ammonia-lyase [Rhizobium sp. KVB221]|uniref:Histidine ammonia-lyase n=1 Tax=Rhizobium setariae TaxID=2801340 RepID=A0A937CQC4_9HYPH|nr:histidine ammonia-lyase [Rhizobium setariae]MBL0374274.1 histidine ammonia-lyase [Rhizobium setariae]
MAEGVVLNDALNWRDLCLVAGGARLVLSDAARGRITTSQRLVEEIVERSILGYGINTGVGALSDVIVDRSQQGMLSHNILHSHCVGVGSPLGSQETRAIMAAQIANFAHGYSGIRLETVEALLTLLNAGIEPVIPSRGSVGYLAHAAEIGLVLIGEGQALCQGRIVSGAEALERVGLRPMQLRAKEGLSLVNGTPCATGLAALALARHERLMDWSDAAAAMSYENLGGQVDVFDEQAMALRSSPGVSAVGASLRFYLHGSAILAASMGRRTQDPLSLRAIPQIHGAARDLFEQICVTVDRELQSVTDNPAIVGTAGSPRVLSQAHAVGAALGFAMDNLAIATAELAEISERRIDRLVNPLVSGLPAFLAARTGIASGFMIAQYTAVSLVSENRRLAAPASLDGGVTSALQEDILTHATPAAFKALAVIDNLELILTIELLAAAQAYDCQPAALHRAPGTDSLYRAVRARVPTYADDRPLNADFARVRPLLSEPLHRISA